MGCGCGGGSKGAVSPSSYVLVYPDGHKETFSSETEARQANRKIAGKGLVRRS